MGEETKQLRRLVIKAYHIREAMWGEENKVEESGVLTVDKESADRYQTWKRRLYIRYFFPDYQTGRNVISIPIRLWTLSRFQRKYLEISGKELLIR